MRNNACKKKGCYITILTRDKIIVNPIYIKKYVSYTIYRKEKINLLK